jgi:hypothetical protein
MSEEVAPEVEEPEEDDPSGEFTFCDLCGQNVLRGEGHKAQCGLPCEGGKLDLGDEVTHDEDCPQCI